MHFEKNITVYNATGYIVFQRTMTFDKGTDKVITVYGTLEELRPCTDVTIVVDIHMKLTLPTPPGLGPSIVQVTIQKEVTTHITE